jgi:hypothetical protein
MGDPPAYPGTGEDAGKAAPSRLTGRQRAVGILLVTAVAALAAVVIILHAVGVMGPGSHG